jgi:hypothetical protein
MAVGGLTPRLGDGLSGSGWDGVAEVGGHAANRGTSESACPHLLAGSAKEPGYEQARGPMLQWCTVCRERSDGPDFPPMRVWASAGRAVSTGRSATSDRGIRRQPGSSAPRASAAYDGMALGERFTAEGKHECPFDRTESVGQCALRGCPYVSVRGPMKFIGFKE